MEARRCVLFILVLLVTAGLTAPLLAQAGLCRVRYKGISFSYPAAFASGIEVIQAEGVPLSEPDVQFWSATAPAHLRFEFLNYIDGMSFRLPLLSDLYQNRAQILVYDYAAIQEFGYGFLDEYDKLAHMLQERPDLADYNNASVRPPEIFLPALPWVNAYQVMRAQPSYLDIAGQGSGIRYVTYYSQESAPLIDKQVFYSFQGIYGEGAYYVSALLPLKTGLLPADFSANSVEDWDAFAANYDSYLVEIFAQINELPDDDFYPPLAMLDDVIQSMRFE